MSQLADALFPKTKQKVLGILFSQPERAIHLREIARMAGVSASSIQREMKSLVDAMIIRKTPHGVMQEFQANPDCPLYEELCGFARKTIGIADVIREVLADLAIDIAFIYGSVAKGVETATSDVDVLIISETGYREALQRVQDVEKRIGRHIDLKHYRPDEFRKLVQSGNPFALNLVQGPHIFLRGDRHGLETFQS